MKAIRGNLSKDFESYYIKLLEKLGLESSTFGDERNLTLLIAIENIDQLNELYKLKHESNTYYILFEKNFLESIKDRNDSMWFLLESNFSFFSNHISLELNFLSIKSRLDERNNDMAELRQIGKNLDRVVSSSLEELQKVRKLHKAIVPLRRESFKGYTVSSKYAAGESTGGDFFDLIIRDSEILIFLSSSCSYVGSSLILNHYDYFKSLQNQTDADFDNLILNISREFNNIGIGDRSGRKSFELLLLKIDINKCTCTGYNYGKSSFVTSTGEINLGNDFPPDLIFKNKASFNFKLDRDQKLVILSPGIDYNNNNLFKDHGIFFIKDRIDQDSAQIIDELFFQLKKDLKSDFLEYDSSVITVEVNPNAIIQV